MQKKNSIISQEIKKILNSGDKTKKLQELFSHVHPHDILTLCETLEPKDIAQIITALGRPKGIELFEQFKIKRQREIFRLFSKEWMGGMLEEMSADERADFIKALPAERREEILPLVAQAERNEIKKLMQYEEGTAGSILTTEYASLQPDLTVREGLERLKLQAFDRETIYYVYVIDKDRKLLGLVSLKNILLAPSDKLIKDIMNINVISVKADEDKEIVAKKLSDYDFLAMPVVDSENKLLGIVTIDDVVDVLREEVTEDIYRYGAAGEHIDYMNSSPFSIGKQRILWLSILVLVGFISGSILIKHASQFQSQLYIPLSFFIPALLASGGNAGTQSSTVVIRGLATGEIKMKDLLKVFRKELFTGCWMGVAMGVLVAIRALITNKNYILAPSIALAVALAMVATLTIATTLGALLPLLFKRMKLDPALMSGPFIASILDVVAIFLYFKIALFIFSL